jgi:cell division protein FtsB
MQKILLIILAFIAICNTICTWRFSKLEDQLTLLKSEVQVIQQEQLDLEREMEDVKSVQGYIVWETDWRNNTNK